jgi:hypothetical protein
MHRRTLVPFEVAQQFADVVLQAAGCLLPRTYKYAAPSGTAPRACTGIPASARAIGAISRAPVREPPHRPGPYQPRQGYGPPAADARSAPRRSAAPRCSGHIPASHAGVAAINPDEDSLGSLSRCRIYRFWRRVVAQPPRRRAGPVPHRARLLRPADSGSSDSRPATLPNGASPAYRAVTQTNSGATVAAVRSKTGKLFVASLSRQGQASRRRTRIDTSPNRERNVTV